MCKCIKLVNLVPLFNKLSFTNEFCCLISKAHSHTSFIYPPERIKVININSGNKCCEWHLAVRALCSWTRWRSSNTAAALRTLSTPSTTPRPALPWSETTSGDTCRWTPPPSTCSSSLKWLHLVNTSKRVALYHIYFSLFILYYFCYLLFVVLLSIHFCKVSLPLNAVFVVKAWCKLCCFMLVIT